MTTAYDVDLAQCAKQQAAFIAAGEWEAVDRENVADELSGLARADRRDVTDSLCRLLENQIKMAAMPNDDDAVRGWTYHSLKLAANLRALLADSPSLCEHLLAGFPEQFKWADEMMEAVHRVRV